MSPERRMRYWMRIRSRACHHANPEDIQNLDLSDYKPVLICTDKLYYYSKEIQAISTISRA
jgi:hypothetical protein